MSETHTTPPAPPRGVGPTGRALWRRVVETYTLRSDELELLRLLCLASDHITRIETKLRGAQVVSTGSQGQLIGHPLLAEFRAHSETIQRLTRQLGLPDIKPQQQEQPRRKTNSNRVSHLAGAGA